MKLRSLFAVVTLAATALAACGGEPSEGSTEDEQRTRGGRIQLFVSVDWEGREIAEANLAAMERLHVHFPQVKVTHFLNAAYFTKPDARPDDVRARVARVVAPSDEKGLHIHGWARLFEAAGVTFRDNPTFWGMSKLTSDCSYDCGHEVPISSYTTEELRKVVRFSLDTLEKNGLGRAKSFRTGGWMAQPNVRDALTAEGIRTDTSAVPAVWLAPQLSSYPLHAWLDELWRGTTQSSQPFTITTASGPLVEVPDNGALADYTSAQQMVDVFEANKAEWLKDRRRALVVSIGFHQETAARYLPQLESALARIYETAARENIPVESVNAEQIRAR